MAAVAGGVINVVKRNLGRRTPIVYRAVPAFKGVLRSMVNASGVRRLEYSPLKGKIDDAFPPAAEALVLLGTCRLL